MGISPLDILVVEDNTSVRNAITFLLKKSGYSVYAVDDGTTALQALNQQYFDLIISDYKMKNMDGMQLLDQVKKNWPATEVIIITAFGTISRGVEAIKLGAFDYITKPFDNQDLLNLVKRFVEKRKTSTEARVGLKNLRELAEFDAIVGNSDKILNLLDIVARIAGKTSTILISGESGTGKELVARAIHDLSARSEKPFVPINCGAVPENLQESEFFGHKKGAFTGADSDKVGLFEVADGGTIFLDEIAEMALLTQVKLLRFLQENEIRRVGDNYPRKVDVRVIAATNKDLPQETKAGHFREDLFYRINVIPIHVSPLRERKDDIPQLIAHFILKYREKNHSPVNGVSRRACAMMMNYDWPGNVRELENVVHRCVALSAVPEISPELLPPGIRKREEGRHSEGAKESRNLADIEREVILETLKRMDGNKKKTAEELGISKTTLWRKLKY